MTVVFTGSHRPTLTRLEDMLHPPPIASNLSAGLMAHSSQRERRQGEYEARVGAVQLTLNSSSTGLCLSLVCVERQQALCCQRGRSSGATTLAAARG